MKSVNLNVRINEDTREKFKAIADAKSQNSSELVRTWIDDYIKKYEEELKMNTIYIMDVTLPQYETTVTKFVQKDFLDYIKKEDIKYYKIVKEVTINSEINDYLNSLNTNYEPAALERDDIKRIEMLVKHFELEIKALASTGMSGVKARIRDLEEHIKFLKKK